MSGKLRKLEKKGLDKKKKSMKMESHPEPIYCQSKEMLNKPRPSLPSVPPNRLVNMSTVLGDAFWLARQKKLIPFSNGKMYAGIIS